MKKRTDFRKEKPGAGGGGLSSVFWQCAFGENDGIADWRVMKRRLDEMPDMMPVLPVSGGLKIKEA